MNNDEWLSTVFSELSQNTKIDFTGVGLIFYSLPLELPVISLTSEKKLPFLPTQDVNDSIALLKEISYSNSRYHDGFHLIDAATQHITHISQFFSPAIPKSIPPIPNDYPIGARYMAALIGSMLPTVSMTAILSKKDGGIAFRNGVIHPVVMMKNA